MKPIVGISAKLEELEGQFGVLDTQMVARTYTEAVRQAGGIPVLLPVDDAHDLDRLLDHIGAVVLTGGGDIDPTRHGREDDGTVYGVVADRDEYDLALATLARARRIPLLAVCRGVQIVNVALGGDLIVDLPTELGDDVVHRIGEHGVVATHAVELESDSQLAELVGTTRGEVTSSHHQAIRTLAEGLRTVARAPDGVIEAVEAVDESWPFLGVQWHPEIRPPDDALARGPFDALVRLAEAAAAPS